jgi:anaerobic selenocysteine-containing dehydrogenase
MPSRDDSGSPVIGPSAERDEQQRLSRRSVLRGAAGAGAAGIAAATLAGVAAPALAATTKAARPQAHDAGTAADADTSDEIVVHVRDARSGQIDLFRGTSQTSVHDRELAARLVRASKK